MNRSKGRLRKTLIAFLAATLLVGAAGAYVVYRIQRRPATLSPEAQCRIGAYELAGGEIVAVRQRDAEQLRVVHFDGRTRSVSPAERAGEYRSGEERPEGAPPALAVEFGACAEGRMALRATGGEPETARRSTFDQQETRFHGEGVELAGRLLLPPGDAPVPIVVLVHGSERDSALDGSQWQFLLPARGLGAFVYDKRGTGRSSGSYSQDFDLLAADAIAAAAEARRLGGARVASLGYFGSSQGGWVAPLAAYLMKDGMKDATKDGGGADFVIAAYGFAESPLAEDRDEVLLGLREAGFDDPATLAKAREVTDATGAVMASGARAGFDRMAAVKAKYGAEPWFEKIDGEFSGDLLRFPPWSFRLLFPLFDVGTSWNYEPMPTLEAIEVPHLWVLAGADREAPSDATFALLRDLQQRRPNLDVARFPTADHGIWVEEKDAAGKSVYSGYAPGYHELVVRWIETHSLNGARAGIETFEGSGSSGGPDA